MASLPTSLYFDGRCQAAFEQRIFDVLAANGVVRIPLRETFWAALYGGLVDEFGVPWEINCGRPTQGAANARAALE